MQGVDQSTILHELDILKTIIDGITKGDPNPSWVAGSFDYPASNPAPLNTEDSNVTIKEHLFDDTTEEFVLQQFKVPSDIDTSGTVTFIIYGHAVTAAASKNVEFTFYHSSKAAGEDFDVAYSSDVSGDLATDATQDNIDRFTWTETVANLGWAANDLCPIKLSRTAPSANNLSGDYAMRYFEIDIPRT